VEEVVGSSRSVRRVCFASAAGVDEADDAPINLIRRMLQRCGTQVLHLGNARSVDAAVRAIADADADAAVISCPRHGGRIAYFSALRNGLDRVSVRHVQLFGCGEGFVPLEIAALGRRGVMVFDRDRLRRQPAVDILVGADQKSRRATNES
jgi:isobutyryl-CoA mutase